MPTSRFAEDVEYPSLYIHDITKDRPADYFTPSKMHQFSSRIIRPTRDYSENVAERPISVYIRTKDDSSQKSNTFIPNETLAERNRRLSPNNNIELIMEQTGATREEANRAYDIHNGDVVNAILDLSR
jgi:NACalpha-BTF3-like transcription factor